MVSKKEKLEIEKALKDKILKDLPEEHFVYNSDSREGQLIGNTRNETIKEIKDIIKNA